MPSDEILIFGSIGTQLVIGRKIYELVALGGEGSATWRTRCVVCRSPVFTEVKDGRLPTHARCKTHQQSSRHPEVPEPDYLHEAEIAEMTLARSAASISPEDFIEGVKAGMDRLGAKHLTDDPSGRYVRAAERGMRIIGEAKSVIEATQLMHPDAAPIQGFVRMHMGDEDDTSVEASVGIPQEHAGGPLVVAGGERGEIYETLSPEEYSAKEMLSELEEMAPKGGDRPPPPLGQEDVWMARLEKFYRDRIWLPTTWGPRPDQPGCWAPQEFLDRFRRR
jgi:hypothetical protein